MMRTALLGIVTAMAVAFTPDPARAADAATSPTLRIVDRPLPEDCWSTRPEGTVVDSIMLHFCSDVIQNPDKPFQIDRIYDIFSTVRVSAHYLIDRDGTVYRMVDEKDKAWHAGRGQLPFEPSRKDELNNLSIGIEMFAIGSEKDMAMFGITPQQYNDLKTSHPQNLGFTDAQYDALNLLVDGIMSRNPAIKKDRFHIVGHEEYATSRRTDPGELFDWARIGLTRERPDTSSTIEAVATTATAAAEPATTRPVWNFFAHYQRRVDAITSAVDAIPDGTTGVIVLLGDSISEGFKAGDIAGRPVVNMGISGDQTDFPTTNTGGVKRRVGLVARARPDDIFLLIGINDLGSGKPVDTLEEHYRAVVSEIRKQVPSARLHIQSVLPTTGRFAFHLPNVADMNRRLEKIAAENGAAYLDIGTAMKNERGELRQDFTGDGLHLLDPAYAVWKETIERQITKPEGADEETAPY